MSFGTELVRAPQEYIDQDVTKLILDCVQQSSSSLSIDDLNEILKIYSVQADSGEDEKQRLEAFLRELLKIVHCLPQTWVERVLLPTLLELMIKSLQSSVG